MRKQRGFNGTLTAFIASIPQKHIASVGKILGMLVYFVDLRHRRIVRRNLQFVHPEWSQDRIQKLSKGVFENLGVTLLEICQMTSFSRKDILRKVRIRGKDNLLNAIKNPKGVILISAHIGNWEMGHQSIACYLQKPLVMVVRELQSKAFDQWILKLRARFGSTIIYKEGALPEMTQTLRQGKVLGLLIDQETKRSEGVDVTFFDRTISATPSAALLAIRCKSPVLPVFCIREADSRLTLVVEPPLTMQRTGGLRADLKTNTQIMTSAIERAVRAYPEQWFWFHKRWKRHYPNLYPEDMARRQRRREKRV